MSINYLTVVLDGNYKPEQAEVIINAIKMIRGVSSVVEGEPETMEDVLAADKYKQEAYGVLFDLIYLAAYRPNKFRQIAPQVNSLKEAN